MAAVQARKDKIVKGLTGGIEHLFKKNKIDRIAGTGRLLGGGKVEVTAEGTAPQIVAQGIADIDGLAFLIDPGHVAHPCGDP